jgi:hypothetical protein
MVNSDYTANATQWPEFARVVDLGEDYAARFAVYLDDALEASSGHQTRWAAERWIEAVARVWGYTTPHTTHE